MSGFSFLSRIASTRSSPLLICDIWAAVELEGDVHVAAQQRRQGRGAAVELERWRTWRQ